MSAVTEKMTATEVLEFLEAYEINSVLCRDIFYYLNKPVGRYICTLRGNVTFIINPPSTEGVRIFTVTID